MFVNRSILALALSAGFVVSGATAAGAALHPGDAAPAFALPSAAGPAFSVAKLKGKPVYLNFFASWCAPCNDEAPAVDALYKKYRGRGLQMLGIDYLEDKSAALGFAKKYGWPFPIALDDGSAGKAYGVFGLPVHVFIDKSGKVSTIRYGEMDPAEIEDAIKKIL
jgi:peroxiredoxin